MDSQIKRDLVPVTQSPSFFGISSDGYGLKKERFDHLRDYINIILKRKWWFLGTFLAIMVIVGIYTFTRIPIYRATATLQIVQDNPGAILGPQNPFTMMEGYDTATKFYETQFQILRSKPIAARLVQSLGLREHPQFQLTPEAKSELSSEKEISLLADQLISGLQIKPIKNTFLVEVSYFSEDKNLAQLIANAVYNEYLRFSMEARQQSYSMVRSWLEDQLGQLAKKVEASEAKLHDYGQKKDFLSLEGDNEVTVKKYVELHKVLTTAQSERAIKEAQYTQVKDKGADAPVITNNPMIQRLREEVISQEAKVSSINKIYGKNYPELQAEKARLQELTSRLNTEVRRSQASLKADYEIALKAEKLLTEQVDLQKGKVQKLQSNLVQGNIIKRDVQTNTQLYEALLARMKEASIGSTMVASNASIINPAELPSRPFSPKKLRNMAMAMLVGLIGGIGMVFVAEYFDDSIKTTQELEKICRVPVLGVVPRVSIPGLPSEDQKRLNMMTFNEPKSMMSEAINNINISIMFSLSEKPPAALIVTSPNPNEGKSTLAVNLSCALVACNSNKVILIDGDMRAGKLHSSFQMKQQPGLSNYLTGQASIAEIIKPTSIDNLFFIPAGTIPPNPVQLLNSKAFITLIEELREKFQHIIFDSPPVIGFGDARLIASQVDGVLLVFRHHSTSREAGQLSVQVLQQINAPILGVILNVAQREKYGYGGYYDYYSNYSKYYKQYHT